MKQIPELVDGYIAPLKKRLVDHLNALKNCGSSTGEQEKIIRDAQQLDFVPKSDLTIPGAIRNDDDRRKLITQRDKIWELVSIYLDKRIKPLYKLLASERESLNCLQRKP